MNLDSKTGKSPKANKGVGRKKKVKKDWSNFSRDSMIVSLEILQDVLGEDLVNSVLERVSKEEKKKKINKTEVLDLLNISRSKYYRFSKKSPKIDKEISANEQIVIDSFVENKGIYGRDRLSVYILKKYGISMNYRTIGRILAKFNLKCVIRKARRKRESKNTNVNFEDLVQRDYNGENQNVVATDVTYIRAPKDVNGNFVFLSVAIHHQSKKILSWNISTNNDTKLVIDHISEISFTKPWIIHSDHGYQYSSQEYKKLVDKINGKISMSRVGNSLDNREVEYFFSILKTECLYLNKIKEMTFKELKSLIESFIVKYNNERFQSNLNWKTPQETWSALKL